MEDRKGLLFLGGIHRILLGFNVLKEVLQFFPALLLVHVALPFLKVRFIPFNFMNMLKISDSGLEVQVDELITLFQFLNFVYLLSIYQVSSLIQIQTKQEIQKGMISIDMKSLNAVFDSRAILVLSVFTLTIK